MGLGHPLARRPRPPASEACRRTATRCDPSAAHQSIATLVTDTLPCRLVCGRWHRQPVFQAGADQSREKRPRAGAVADGVHERLHVQIAGRDLVSHWREQAAVLPMHARPLHVRVMGQRLVEGQRADRPPHPPPSMAIRVRRLRDLPRSSRVIAPPPSVRRSPALAGGPGAHPAPTARPPTSSTRPTKVAMSSGAGIPSAWKRPIPSVAGKTNFNRPSPTNTPPAMSRIRRVAGGAASAGGLRTHCSSLCIVVFMMDLLS